MICAVSYGECCIRGMLQIPSHLTLQRLTDMMKGIAAELIETHREELLRFLNRRLNCRETALDIVQDCFMRLVGYMETNTLQNPRAFLFRIAANQATDYLRRQCRVDERATDALELSNLTDPAPGTGRNRERHGAYGQVETGSGRIAAEPPGGFYFA